MRWACKVSSVNILVTWQSFIDTSKYVHTLKILKELTFLNILFLFEKVIMVLAIHLYQ